MVALYFPGFLKLGLAMYFVECKLQWHVLTSMYGFKSHSAICHVSSYSALDLYWNKTVTSLGPQVIKCADLLFQPVLTCYLHEKSTSVNPLQIWYFVCLCCIPLVTYHDLHSYQTRSSFCNPIPMTYYSQSLFWFSELKTMFLVSQLPQ